MRVENNFQKVKEMAMELLRCFWPMLQILHLEKILIFFFFNLADSLRK